MRGCKCLAASIIVSLCAGGTAIAGPDRSVKIAGVPMPVTPAVRDVIDIGNGGPHTRTLMELAIYDNVPILHDGTPGVIDITTGLPADFFFIGGTADAGDWITARMPRAGDAPAGGVFTQVIESLLFGISYTAPASAPMSPSIPITSDLMIW